MKTSFNEWIKNAEYIYPGVVVKLDDKLYLVLKRDEQNITDGFPISDFEQIYTNLLPTQIQLVEASLFDGTENMELESVLSRDNFEDIGFVINDFELISIGKNNDENDSQNVDLITMKELIENGDFVNMVLNLIDENLKK